VELEDLGDPGVAEVEAVLELLQCTVEQIIVLIPALDLMGEMEMLAEPLGPLLAVVVARLVPEEMELQIHLPALVDLEQQFLLLE
jgi:hypothetical protein